MDKIKYLRFNVQRVLPLVYDDSLSYYELLNKVVKKLNDTIEITNENLETIRDVVIEWLEENDPETILGLDKLKTYNTPLDFKVAIDSTDDDMFRALINDAETSSNKGVIPPGVYNLSKGYATDEAFIVANQGVYTNNGVSVSKLINFEMYNKIIAEKTNSALGLSNDYMAQGSCYCRPRNSIYVFFLNTQDATGGKIIEFDPSLNVIRSAFVNLFHGPGLFYDNMSNRIVAVGGDDDPYHYLYFIDPSTLAITETKDLRTSKALHGVARDNYGNWFIMSGHDLIIYDSDWAIIKTFPGMIDAIVSGYGDTGGLPGTTLFQTLGSAYEGQVFLLYNVVGPGNEFLASVVGQLNYAKSDLKQIHVGSTSTPLSEGESIFFILNKMYMIESLSPTHRIRLIECASMDNSSILNRQTIGPMGGRIAVTRNSDLNDYTLQGVYYSPDSTYTATLSNYPTYQNRAAGFVLFIKQQGNVNIRQEICYNDTTMPMYFRTYDGGTDTWTPWRVIPTTVNAVMDTINNAAKLIHDNTVTFTIDVTSWCTGAGNFYFEVPCLYAGTPTITGVSTILLGSDATGEVNIAEGYSDIRVVQSGNIPYFRVLLETITDTRFRNKLAKLTLVMSVKFE